MAFLFVIIVIVKVPFVFHFAVLVLPLAVVCRKTCALVKILPIVSSVERIERMRTLLFYNQPNVEKTQQSRKEISTGVMVRTRTHCLSPQIRHEKNEDPRRAGARAHISPYTCSEICWYLYHTISHMLLQHSMVTPTARTPYILTSCTVWHHSSSRISTERAV